MGWENPSSPINIISDPQNSINLGSNIDESSITTQWVVSVLLSPESEYIIDTDHGIFLDIQRLAQDIANMDLPLQQMRNFLFGYLDRVFFTEECVLVGLDYSIIASFLYEDISEIRKLVQDYKTWTRIQIARWKQKIIPSKINFLYGINGRSLTFQWSSTAYDESYLASKSTTMLQATEHSGKSIEFTFPVDHSSNKLLLMFGSADSTIEPSFDTFFWYLWSHGIRYGIQFQEISKFLGQYHPDKWETHKNIVVAVPKVPISGKSDIIQYIRWPEAIRKQPIKATRGGVDYHEFMYSFPQAEKWKPLLLIKIGYPGITGIGVNGWQIPSSGVLDRYVPRVSDISPENNAHTLFLPESEQYIRVSTMEDAAKQKVIIVYAEEDVFVSGNTKDGILLSKEIVHKKNIGWVWKNSTGTSIRIGTQTRFVQSGGEIENGYSLSGWKIWINWGCSVAWAVCAEWDINIQSSSIVGWHIETEDGNIIIEKSRVHSNSYLRSNNGKVTITWNIENSTIIADEVVVDWSVSNCTILARKVVITKSSKGNKIAGESIDIWQEGSQDTSNSTYIILAFLAVERYLDMLEQKMKGTEIRIRENSPDSALQRQSLQKDQSLFARLKDASDRNLRDIGWLHFILRRPVQHQNFTRCILPIEFIMSNAFYGAINSKEKVAERKKIKRDSIDSILQKLQKLQQSTILVKWGEPVTHDDLLAVIKSHNDTISAGVSRLDSHREILLPSKVVSTLFSRDSIPQSPFVVPITLNGMESRSFIWDMSDWWISFYSSNKDDASGWLEEWQIINIAFRLQQSGKVFHIWCGLRIASKRTFPEWFTRYAGEFIGLSPESQKEIRLYMRMIVNLRKPSHDQ